MATKKKVAPPLEIDWPATLQTGRAGVAQWNERSETARQMTKLGRGDYAGCDLAGINFGGQSVLKFQGAGVDFADATLTRGSFIEADLRGANFAGAEMTKFCARNADLTGAKLPHVSLRGGRLVGAKFVGADLSGADLTGADITGTDFSDANLTGTVFAELVFDQTTVWPAGFEIPAGAKWSPDAPDPRFNGVGEEAVAVSLDGLLARLNKVIDANRMTRTVEMLKTGTNQLFSEIEPAVVRGVVRSQREPDLVYSCLIEADGTYSCGTPDLTECMGLRGEPCKHLLVLLIGLTKAGELDAGAADRLVVAAGGKKHKWNERIVDQVSDTLLKYKGAQAGEIDWRPTETIPEDFYAM
ncbi:pentapeptide repeat-containing protein [Gemmata sp. G18]|uniref:Pentapeptide repeat-containing protein n=1 Tax=Gemmata palustris TaxID=2822762 RepID=A0ABS5BTI2_9BACT|nr:pentapeptide repeat-containing protein [Gemmata palustris]MBP3957037.1 pentapeptide repeat-containing protein [Gemmata palustris]